MDKNIFKNKNNVVKLCYQKYLLVIIKVINK